jgi:hypothetical protein
VIDPEAESQVLSERSDELAQMLDAGHPVVEQNRAALAESERLASVARQTRSDVAARVAAGLDPGCPVGPQPAIRRVRTDARGRDLDPLRGRSVVSPELLAYWEHRRDVVAVAVEAQYRQAAERTPYRQALVAAAQGHIATLRERHSMHPEHGAELEAALRRYDSAYAALREAAIDAQQIAVIAEGRLASLQREAAATLVPRDEVKGLIGATLSTVLDLPVDPETAMPLVPVSAPPSR